MMMLTFITIYLFGWNIYKNAYTNFIKYREVNMETLISIGSLASLTLSFY